MISMLIRVVLMRTTRLFFRQIAVIFPAMPSGPVVVVANHPNGLVDPLMVRLALDHPVKGMAKSTLFKNPVSKTVMQAFDSLPVYRRVDGEDTGKNASMFSACQECLEEGGALMIFPEGVSHDATELLPLKTGAARIALGAESDNRYELGVRILPVGLIYEDKAIFRSRVAVVVGEPLEIEAFKERHEEEPYEAAKELTHEIAQALSSVMLEADDSELWTGFLAVASWMNEDALDAMDERQGRARELASGFRWLQEHDPATAQKLVDEVRGFAQMFEAVGVENPLDLERVEVRTSRIVGAALWLLVLAPFALLGAILGWLPYRLIRPLSFAVARGELDVVSSIKAIAGLVFMPLTYLLEGLLAWKLFGFWAGVSVVLLAPLLGLVTMHFVEGVMRRRSALSKLWLKATKASTLEAIEERRRELIERIEALLERYREHVGGDFKGEKEAASVDIVH